MKYYQLFTLNLGLTGVNILREPSYFSTKLIIHWFKYNYSTGEELYYIIYVFKKTLKIEVFNFYLLVYYQGGYSMESKQTNRSTKYNILKLMNSAICDMAEFPKKMLKYAIPASLALLAIGTVLFVINKTSNNFSSVFEFTTTTLITNSIIVMAEFVIASLVIDIIIKKRSK